jgi:hypothetical protein
MHEDR